MSDIEQARDVIFKAQQRILNAYGITKHNRYAGEFPYAKDGQPQLSEVWALRDENARDEIAAMITSIAGDLKWNALSVKTENNAKDSHYPYSLEITVTGAGIETTMDAYKKMGQYLSSVASAYPRDTRMEWDAFKNNHQRGAGSQIHRFGMIAELFRADAYVIGTHRSKSITLPVAQIELPHNGTRITFRDNFHDVCISVEAKFPVKNDGNLQRLFNTAVTGGCFEGFPEGMVKAPYNEDRNSFSLTLNNDTDLVHIINEIARQDRAYYPPIKPKAP